MPRRTTERKGTTETITNMSSLATRGGVARKSQICDMSPTPYRPHHLEKSDPPDRSFWKNDCASIVDLHRIDYQPSPCHSRQPTIVRAKKTREEKKNNADKKLAVSMRNLSLGISTLPIARSVTKKSRIGTNEVVPYVRRSLVAWTAQVFAEVGPGQKEIKYHVALKELILSKGLDVGFEVPLKFERRGSKPISKRADLIVSMPGVSERVLIECKAKKKILREDFEQVLFYQHHFGISQCYLINFCIGTQVLETKTTHDKTQFVEMHNSQQKRMKCIQLDSSNR